MIKSSNYDSEFPENCRWCEGNNSSYNEWTYEGNPKAK